MNRIIQPIIALLLSTAVIAQTPAVSFQQFAKQQDSIFISLYQQRNVKTYDRLLQQWLTRYKKCSEAEQQQYRPYLVSAYYNFACTYALVNDRNKAIDQLENAVKTGYSNYEHILHDTDLDSLRALPRFQSIVQYLRSVGDYRYILARGAAYDTTDHRALPAFTYQPASNPGLVALRQSFHLDSIAGQGNDVSKALNILHWVHGLIPHDGNHGNPALKNAMALIAICRKENRGLNCRGLATVLNECYLSLGFASRLVTCLPKDSLQNDPDCHVINVVYMPSLKKWIWTDPTHDAYVMNEKGELLGIEEVRQRIIENKPLLLNPTANWNYQTTTTKEDYLYQYMAKNLYMLQCPANSEYNMETASAGKRMEYIQLVPLDYPRQSPAVKTTTENTQATYVIYNTNNPSVFWKLP